MKLLFKNILLSVCVCAVLLTVTACFGNSEETGTDTSPDTETAEVQTTETTSPETEPPVTEAPETEPPETEPETEALPPLLPPAPEFPKETEPELDRASLSAQQQTALGICESMYSAAVSGKTPSADHSAISGSWSEVYDVVSDEMRRYYVRFKNGDISYGNFTMLMSAFSEIENARGLAEGYIKIAEAKHSEDIYADAENYAKKGKYMLSAKKIASLARNDRDGITKALELVASDAAKFKKGITEAVTEYMVRYEIEEGKTFLERLRGYGIDDHIDKELARLEKHRAYQEDDLRDVVVAYTLQDIYTHCLIAFPEITFASQATYKTCGTDCITPSELTFLLQSLYDKGYVIVDPDYLYNAEEDTVYRTVKLPRGKKPLVLTFDDVTYDSRKMGRGMVDKLILDEDGYVCTYTKHANGKEVISYENEIFPIIDAFVRKHPDFSFRGARGTLFFTGFDGICGYRTQSEPVDDREAALGLDRQDEISKAMLIIEALREEGWTFGCHGYNHRHMPTLTEEQFKWEIDAWREEVGAIVGDTGLFCWPYGDHGYGDLRKGDLHKYMFDRGFYFYFGTGAGTYYADELDELGIFSDRKGVTGQVLVYIAADYGVYAKNYTPLFDKDKIWDPLRAKYKDWLLEEFNKKMNG